MPSPKVTTLLSGLLLSVVTACTVKAMAPAPLNPSTAVQALFDVTTVDDGPFPSDYFTVEDQEQNTGLRVNLPLPDFNTRA